MNLFASTLSILLHLCHVNSDVTIANSPATVLPTTEITSNPTLAPVVINDPISETLFYEYPSCIPDCLQNRGGCPNNVPCHQITDAVYRIEATGNCYSALTTCWGCLKDDRVVGVGDKLELVDCPLTSSSAELNIWHDDYKIDFGADSGWKIYEETSQSDIFDPSLPLCSDDECEIKTDVSTYYGVDGTTVPAKSFNDPGKYMMERHFECPAGDEYWSMTISWKIGFCGIPSYDKRVHTTLFVDNLELSKTNFHSEASSQTSNDASSSATVALNDAELDSICASGWETQTITVSNIIDEMYGYIPGGNKVSTTIRTRLRTATQYALVYGISVQCVDLGDDANVLPGPDHDDDGPVYAEDNVCVSIASQGAYAHLYDEYTGEYVINGEMYNGAVLLVKYDGGVIWWNDETMQWVLGSDAGDTIIECSVASSHDDILNTNYLQDGEVFCDVERVYDSNGNVIVGADESMIPAITEGECKNDHVVVSDGPMIIEITDQTRAMLTLAGLLLMSCVFGMVTCCVCLSINDWRKNKKYQKVAKEEIMDF